MITPRVTPVDEPREFLPQELFFSLTDQKGLIRYGNQVFTRISGYGEEELVGEPHNIIRHPDMPRCVFKLLWDYLESGKTIAAYVKNLAKDGRYYWVLALVFPCREGYLSVRLKPSSGLFDAARSIYAEVLAEEQKIEDQSDRKAAMEQSSKLLMEKLAAAGFETYDDFMRTALATELSARDGMNAAEATTVKAFSRAFGLEGLQSLTARTVQHMRCVFRSLESFQELSKKLAEKQEVMESLGPSLSFLALSSNVTASRMGSDGAVLTVVSRSLGESAAAADKQITALKDRMAITCLRAQKLEFDVAVAQLEAEVCQSFANEVGGSDAAQAADLIAECLVILNSELTTRSRTVMAGLHELSEDVRLLGRSASQIVRHVEQMKTSQLSGKIEIATCPNSGGFQAIFEDVAQIVETAKEDCAQIIGVLEDSAEQIDSLLEVEHPLSRDLDAVAYAVSDIGEMIRDAGGKWDAVSA